MDLKLSSSIESMGTSPERDVPDGYYDELGVDERLEVLSKIKGVSGLLIFYPVYDLPADPDNFLTKISNFNLKPAQVYVDINHNRKWKNGALSTNEDSIRKDAIKIVKDAIDFTKAINADSVLLWPGMDGIDYPFMSNPDIGWGHLIESIREIGEYDKNIKIAVEPKQDAPRQKMYLSNIGKLMMLLNEINMDNVGGVLDAGHVNISQGQMAEALVILNSHKKLFAIHLDDNYKNADPDMIMGSVNFWEFLELFYYLNKTDFSGYLDIYIESPRDDRVKSLELAVNLTLKFKKLADKLTKHSEIIDANLKNYKFANNFELISDLVFK